jgi:hypothetical protein
VEKTKGRLEKKWMRRENTCTKTKEENVWKIPECEGKKRYICMYIVQMTSTDTLVEKREKRKKKDNMSIIK